jgi:hypothetical protein
MKFLFLNFLFIAALIGEDVQSYSLNVKSSKGEYFEQMKVQKTSGGYIIEYRDRAGENSINIFNNDLDPQETSYFDKNNNKYLKSIYDFSQKKIITTGDFKKSYNLNMPVYDGNGSMFFIFSKILPKPDHEYIFNMLQIKEKRIVKMVFKYVGKDQIKTGRAVRYCLKYEMKISNPVLSFFWPYKYFYWFDETSRKFIRYEGPAGHENNEVIEVEN